MPKRQVFRFKRVIVLVVALLFSCFSSEAGRMKHVRVWWIVLDRAYHADPACVRSEMESKGLHVRSCSKWLNAVSVVADESELNWIKSNYVVDEISPVLKLNGYMRGQVSPVHYSIALEQMQASAFERAGLSGLNVRIGVTDAGFLFMNNPFSYPGLQRLFSNGQIRAARDFVRNIDTVSYSESYYTGKEPRRRPWNPIGMTLRYLKLSYHAHGSDIMSGLAALDTVSLYQNGLALDSYYYLARTEEGNKEFKAEEDFYIAALEWLHSKGVRIVNTSLGYGEGRKRKSDNYTPGQMNGQSMIARAVDIACREKNMLVVVAAGNEGNKRRWQVVSTPGDAPAALTVGAVDAKMQKEAYSGKGPEYNAYIKPDVAAYSLTGTSLSAPAVAGFAACLLEKRPDLSPAQLKDIILRSSHLYPFGNNYIGYGVPLASRALALLEDSSAVVGQSVSLHVKESKFEISDPGFQIPYILSFHKKNDWVVLRQELMKKANEKGVYTIIRPEGATRTTIQAGFRIYEIFWEK